MSASSGKASAPRAPALSESCGKKDLTSEHVALLEKLLGTDGSHSADFPGGIRAEKRYDELRLIRPGKEPAELTGIGEKAALDGTERMKNRLLPESEEAYLVRVFPYSGNPIAMLSPSLLVRNVRNEDILS